MQGDGETAVVPVEWADECAVRRVILTLRNKAREYEFGDKPSLAEGKREEADAIERTLKAALAAAPATQPSRTEEAAEPVAYRWQWPGQTTWGYAGYNLHPDAETVQPLFASPPPAVSAEDVARVDVQRLMHPVLTYLRGHHVTGRIAEEATERAVDAMYRALNPSALLRPQDNQGDGK